MNGRKWDAVATYHENPWTCGVTRWNQRLAQELGVPLVSWLGASDRALRSIKPEEMGFTPIPKGKHLLHKRDGVWFGDIKLWCPGTIPIYPRDAARWSNVLNMVTFGMSHKIQAKRYAQLAALQTHKRVQLSVSTAIHEGTSLDAQFTSAYEDISAIFNGQTQFLGWLADAALGTVMSQADVFVAFFDQGVRANNTTIMSALAAGCPVLTNLDDSSPDGFTHLDTVIDINQCGSLPDVTVLDAIGRRGRAMVNERYSWKKLVEVLNA